MLLQTGPEACILVSAQLSGWPKIICTSIHVFQAGCLEDCPHHTPVPHVCTQVYVCTRKRFATCLRCSSTEHGYPHMHECILTRKLAHSHGVDARLQRTRRCANVRGHEHAHTHARSRACVLHTRRARCTVHPRQRLRSRRRATTPITNRWPARDVATAAGGLDRLRFSEAPREGRI